MWASSVSICIGVGVESLQSVFIWDELSVAVDMDPYGDGIENDVVEDEREESGVIELLLGLVNEKDPDLYGVSTIASSTIMFISL